MRLAINVRNNECRIARADDSTRRYLDGIKKYVPLTAEEERTLLKKYADAKSALKSAEELRFSGDMDCHEYEGIKARCARVLREVGDKMVNHNLRFVYGVAIRIGSTAIVQDLVSEGAIGILNALETFDLSLGNRFLSHAVWYIRRNMIAFIVGSEKGVKMSRERIIVPKVKYFESRHFAEFGTMPSTQEIMDFLWEEHKLAVKSESDLHGARVSSIDDGIGDDDNDATVAEYSEFASSTASANGYLETMEEEDRRSMLMDAMEKLTEREKEIILLTSGMKDGVEWGNEEIGKRMGLTGERVRQIAVRAREKMSMDKRLAKAYNRG